MHKTTIHREQAFTSHRWSDMEGAMSDLDAEVAAVWETTGSSVFADIERYHWHEASATGLVEGRGLWLRAAHLVNAFDFEAFSNPHQHPEGGWLQVGEDIVFKVMLDPVSKQWMVFRCTKVEVGAKRAATLSGRTLKERPGGYTMVEPVSYLNEGWADCYPGSADNALELAQHWAQELREDARAEMDGDGWVDEWLTDHQRAEWGRRNSAEGVAHEVKRQARAWREVQRREALDDSSPEVAYGLLNMDAE